MIPQLLFGLAIAIATIARAGWLAGGIAIAFGILVVVPIGAVYIRMDARSHVQDDEGWTLSAITLWITNDGERRNGRGHIGVAGFRWEPLKPREGVSTAFSLPWGMISTADVSRKAPYTSILQIKTTDDRTFNLVVQKGPATVERALQIRPA